MLWPIRRLAIVACLLFGILVFGGMSEARTVRVATYNVLFGVGAPGGAEYNAVKDILVRVNADVIAFQELRSTNIPAWQALALELGYSNTAVSGATTLSGGLYTGYYSRHPIRETSNVLSPPGANEITRPPFRAVIDIPDVAVPLVLWTLHHKAGGTSTDEFRRAVESIRCAQDIDNHLDANPTHLEYVVLGDMNEDVNQSQAASFSSLPSGLPASYALGSDINFPVFYATFPRDAYETAGFGMIMLDAYQTGTGNAATFVNSAGRLDYIFVSEKIWNSDLGQPVAEVYNSTYDSAVAGLPKNGAPLPSGTSSTASDHYLVFADIQVSDASFLAVSPEEGIHASGLAGGTFSPASWTYAISNALGQPLVWGVEMPSWLDSSTQGGVMAPEESIEIILQISPSARDLDVGRYSSLVRFIDHTSGGAISRPAVLDVLPEATLAVAPPGPVSFYGPEGGPYLPSSALITISNAGATDLNWEAFPAHPVDLSGLSGTLSPGSSTQSHVSIAMTATNLPAGIHTFALPISNLVNGAGSTSLIVQVHVLDASGLFENGETGGLGWMASGLWHLTDRQTSLCAKARSGSLSWWYGREATCNYNTGGTNTGSLVSPDFIVPPSAFLTYASWEETEGQGLNWDQRIVQISTNGGASWISLYQSFLSTGRWQNVVVDLSPYAMRMARIRFVFDTVDGVANAYPGWYVDDIRVASAGTVVVNTAHVRFAGRQGGPFMPGAHVISITNGASAPVTWRIQQVPFWAAVGGNNGFLDPAARTNIDVFVNGDSTNLPAGLYAGWMQVENAMGGAGSTNILVELLVRDSLPDEWREQYFGHVEPRADDLSLESDDPDGDDLTNRGEFIAGTDPLDPASFFNPLAGLTLDLDGVEPAEGLWVEIRNSRIDRVYDLFGSDSLDQGAPWLPLGIKAPGNGGSLWLYLTSGNLPKFLRVSVQLP